MSLLYIQQLSQPLSQLESPTESNESKFESQKPLECKTSTHQPLDSSEEVWQIKQVYHLERRLFL